jgi:hypothetical protein
MSCDQCWDIFSNRKKIAKLKKENKEMKKAVNAALIEIESTHELVGEYIDRVDAILTHAKKTYGEAQ